MPTKKFHSKWIRVTRAHPCSVCGRFDWDTYSPELGLACCMRISSARPSKNGGWLHPLDAAPVKVEPVKHVEPPHINATAMMRKFRDATDLADVALLAKDLGVAGESLWELGIAWAAPHNAWAWPMKDEYGNTIGVRLRSSTGHKWAVTGSRAGLFYGSVRPGCVTCVTEGPTDASAAMTIGLQAIGRPSCLGQEEMLRAALAKARRVLIISDNDSPGFRGAERLQGMLNVPNLIWCPPCKDMREFVQKGGTQELIETLTKSMIWNVPKTL